MWLKCQGGGGGGSKKFRNHWYRVSIDFVELHNGNYVFIVAVTLFKWTANKNLGNTKNQDIHTWLEIALLNLENVQSK